MTKMTTSFGMIDKAIKSGKERRKPYFGSKRFDRTCRNHGSCPYCTCNRTFSRIVDDMQEQLEEFFEEKKIDKLENS